MIATIIALALQAPPVPVLGSIGRQELPAHGCAAFLWRANGEGRTEGPLAMASADPALLRLALDGTRIDLQRVAQTGQSAHGLTASSRYESPGVAATLEITIVTRADLRDGAAVPQATLRVARQGQDEIVVPLAGLVGCRATG